MRIYYFFRFLWIFLMEFLKSNVSVARTVLFVPRNRILSTIMDYDTADLNPSEIIILAQLITLTPGTVVIDVDPQFQKLKVHILDTQTPDIALQRIERIIKPALLKVTR